MFICFRVAPKTKYRKIEFFSILSILNFVEKKFYNFNPLDCETVDFYEPKLLNFNFHQPERTQSLYYESERRSGPF